MNAGGSSRKLFVGSSFVSWSFHLVLALALVATLVPAASYAQDGPDTPKAQEVDSAEAPSAPQRTRLPLHAVDTLYVVEVVVETPAQFEQLLQMGYACAEAGVCRLEVSGNELSALKEAGWVATVVEQAVVFSTEPSLPAPGTEQHRYGENLTDYSIPDYSGGVPGQATSGVNISGAPSGSMVTKIKVSLRVAHTFPRDLEIYVGHDSPATYVSFWYRQGGTDDGGEDDDGPSDDDVELYERVDVARFDGDMVNQAWFLDVYDRAADDTGHIDWFKLWVYYCPVPEAPTLDSPVHTAHICDTTPTLQWFTVAAADNYQLQVDDDWDLSSPERDVTILAFNYTLTTPLMPGAYWWRVRAHDDCGWGDWSSIWYFDLNVPPDEPVLVSPANASHTCDTTPSFDWSDVADATGYRIQVDDIANFPSPEINVVTTLSEYTPISPLAPGQYYWRVLAINNCGDSGWSGIGNFVIDEIPPAPNLTSPADGLDTCDTTPTFEWSWVTGAVSYCIQVDNNGSFASPEINLPVYVTQYTSGAALNPDTYFWRVKACNNCGCGSWSSVRQLSINTVPAAPGMLAPANLSHTCDTTPAFDWSDVTGTTVYSIQVDDSPSFSSPELDHTMPMSSYTPTTPLAPGTYSWRVKASNDCGDGSWSAAWSFTIDPTPSAPSLGNPEDTSHTCDPTQSFEWSYDTSATSYRIQVDDDHTFSAPEINTTVPSPGYTPTSPLPPGTYHWRVRTYNSCGSGPWSDVWDFTIDPLPAAPLLDIPVDGSHTCETRPEFVWSYVAGATSYRIQVDDDRTFSAPEINTTTTTPGYVPTSPLPPGTYHWQVRAINNCGHGPWSNLRDFTIDGPPAAPGSPSPADGATAVAVDANLDWADANSATSYDVYFGLATTPPFSATTTTSQYDLPTLSTTTHYYWKIVAKNACGETAGTVWDFTTGDTANQPPTNGTINPNSGSAPAGQVKYFTTTCFDPDGHADLKACRLHIGDSTRPKSLRLNAVLLYQVQTNKIMIRSDNGRKWWGGKLVGSANVIQNKQAKVYCDLTTVTKTGNKVTVRWAVEFKPAFKGLKKLYLKTRDLGGLSTPLQKKGTWTVQ